MKYYLIDWENLGTKLVDWLKAINRDNVNRDEQHKIILYWSTNTGVKTTANWIALIQEILNLGIEVTFRKCPIGSEMMDKCILFDLGYMVKSDPDGTYVIVSNDVGFRTIVEDYFPENGVCDICVTCQEVSVNYGDKI